MAENTIDYASFQGLVSNEDLDAMAATLSKLLDEEGCELVSVMISNRGYNERSVDLCFCVRDRNTGYTDAFSKRYDPHGNDRDYRWVALDVRAYALDFVAKVEIVTPSVARLRRRNV